MTLDQLRYFLAVAETMSFTRAAKLCYISQPSLSRHIAMLEEELGAGLFIRASGSIALTGAGKMLREDGDRILDQLFEAEQRIRGLAVGKTGALSLVSPGFYSPKLCEALRGFGGAFPDIAFELSSAAAEAVPGEVAGFSVDMGVTFSYKLEEHPGLETLRLGEETFCILVPEDHRLARREAVGREDLDGETLIAYGDSSVRSGFVERLYAGLGREFSGPGSVHRTVLSLDSALLRLRAGRGLLLLPGPLAAGGVPGCRALGIYGVDTRFHTVLIWSCENRNPAIGLFTDFLRKVYPAP